MKNQKLKKKWARLYGNPEDLKKIAKHLRVLGFRVITFSDPEKIEPELQIGRNVYRGEKIEEMLEMLGKTN